MSTFQDNTPKRLNILQLANCAWQLCDKGYDSIFYTSKDYEFWTMALELLYKIIVGSDINLAMKILEMCMDHVRWDGPVILGNLRSKIVV